MTSATSQTEGAIEIERLSNGDLIVKRANERKDAKPRAGLVVHGYGGNKEEMLGLAINMVGALGVRLLLFDLPGHSAESDDLLTLDSAKAAVLKRAESLKSPAFFLGHSLGARLGLMIGLHTASLLSLPGPELFAGNRKELLSTLRARRVRERSTYEGLREVLAVDVNPAPRTQLLYAKNDIKTSLSMARQWAGQVDMIAKIPASNHLDIVSHKTTQETIISWLKRELI